MSHINQTIIANYDEDKIKQLIIADMLKHGFAVTANDIKYPDEWASDATRAADVPNTIYVRFERFEVRKIVPVHEKSSGPITR